MAQPCREIQSEFLTRPTGFKANSASAFAAPRCGAFHPLSNRIVHGTTASSMLPALPGVGRQKAAAAGWLAGETTSRPSPALEKQDRIRARASSPSKVASPPGGRGSAIPRQHHAAVIHQERHAAGSSPFQLRTCLSSSTCSTFQQGRREQRRRKLILPLCTNKLYSLRF